MKWMDLLMVLILSIMLIILLGLFRHIMRMVLYSIMRNRERVVLQYLTSLPIIIIY